MIPKINPDIPGWPLEYDLYVLGWLSSCVRPGDSIIEIGSWCGRSSHAIAANRKEHVHLELVDNFRIEPPYVPDTIGQDASLQGSQDNIKLAMSIGSRTGSWLPACQHFLYGQHDINIQDCDSYHMQVPCVPSMVFIDGQHTGPAPWEDIQRFIDCHECLIVLDDWRTQFPDVLNASVLSKVHGLRAIYSPPFGRLAIILPRYGYMVDAAVDMMRMTSKNRFQEDVLSAMGRNSR